MYDIKTEHDGKITRYYFDSKSGTHRFCIFIYEDDPYIWTLSNVYVEEDYRRQGLGNQILTIVKNMAISNDAHKIRLWTEKDSMPYHWYHRKGYVDMGIDYEGKPNNVWLELNLGADREFNNILGTKT